MSYFISTSLFLFEPIQLANLLYSTLLYHHTTNTGAAKTAEEEEDEDEYEDEEKQVDMSKAAQAAQKAEEVLLSRLQFKQISGNSLHTTAG